MNLTELPNQAKNMWTGFNNKQKIIIAGSALTVFILLILSAFFLGKTTYEPLYPSTLSINESAMITAKLKEMNVDYKLADDGTTILVPAALKHQLRLDLANELPRGGVIGFESFEETKFGETDTDKRIRYLAALQNELTRTIQEMAEVDLAKVHIVLPEESLFISEEKPATASVLLKLKPYATVDRQKIRSIIYFISNSVEGLSPENVTVIDVHGNLLSEGVINDNGELATANLTVTQLEIKKQFENDLSKSLQTMLEKVKGPGKAVVRASVELDFDQVETSSEEYGDQVLRSEQVKEEYTEGVTTGSNPPVGVESNLPQLDSYQGMDNSETSSEKIETIRNYEISRVLETRKKAPGEIKRLSVAVIIDGELTAQEQEAIASIVSNAAGINEARGDSVSVTSLAFSGDSFAALQEELEQMQAAQQRAQLIKYGIWGMLILLSVLAVFLIIRRMRTKAETEVVSPPQTIGSYEEMLASISPEDQEKLEIEKRVEKIAKTQPDNAAKIIKTWLAEDSR